jgi:hypothetical protein
VTEIGTNAFDHTALTSLTIPDSVANISSYAFSCGTLQTVKINCCTEEENNIVTTLGNIYPYSSTLDLHTLQIALSSSIAAKPSANLLNYVAKILALESPTDNAIINAISNNSGLFELDLSNTELTQANIDSMNKTLPWTVIFRDGARIAYSASPSI